MRASTKSYQKCLGLVVVLSLAAAVLISPGHIPGDPTTGRSSAAQARHQRLIESYGKLPLSFEINQGQTDPRVKFLARGHGYSLFLTKNEAVLTLRRGNASSKFGTEHASHLLPVGELQRASFNAASTDHHHASTTTVLRMKLMGANSAAKVSGLEELPGKSNYLIGNDPKRWRTNVANYARVEYANVYPGVDLVYYGNQRQLEYDFVVQPGSDPRQIKLALQSSTGSLRVKSAMRTDRDGDLVVRTPEGEVWFHKPMVYQQATVHRAWKKGTGENITDRHFVDGRYILTGNRVTFEVASYDKTKPLVIDPTLTYSTYLGGGLIEEGLSIAVDGAGNGYVAGLTSSRNFPITPGTFQTSLGAPFDAFVTKLNAAGSALLYSTYLGGSSLDWAGGIAIDASGNAYVTGETHSTDFPTTSGAFQTTFGGEGYSGGDAFVSKLNAAGAVLLYSTYLGGSSTDEGDSIALDASGNAYVTGFTSSSDFPITLGAFQTTFGGGESNAFVTKLNAAGSALLYSTYLGGSYDDGGSSIVLDSSDNAYVTGFTYSTDFPVTPGAFQTTFGGNSLSDAFVTKLNAAGSALLYSTYLGGNQYDFGFSIAVDDSGSVYITGHTDSPNFPTTPHAFHTTCCGAFVTKFNATGSALLYSTYLGGSSEGLFGFRGGIALDASGNAYVTGDTSSTDFPTTPGAFQTVYGGGGDAFVAKLNATGSGLIYSTYLGGNSYDFNGGIALDTSGNAYVIGSTDSTNFPILMGGLQTRNRGAQDAFVSMFSFGPSIPFSRFGGRLLVDPDAGVFWLSGSFKLGPGGSINPPNEQVNFSVGSYSVALSPGSFVQKSTGYIYQKTVNNIFLCVYIKTSNTPGSYIILVNSGRGALSGTTPSPVPVTLAIGNDSGNTQMNARFN